MQGHKLLLGLTLIAASCAQVPDEEPEVVYETGGTGPLAGRGGSSGQGAAGSGVGRGGVTGSGGSAAGSGGAGAGGSAGSSGGTSGATDAGVDAAGSAGTAGIGSGGGAGSAGSGGTAAGGSAGTSAGTGGSGGGPATGLSIQYMVEISGASGSAIGSQLWIVNNSTNTLNLNDLTLRYYFTNEVTGALIQTINWANIGPISGGSTTNLASGEITIKTVALAPPVATADSYVEFGFNAGGKTLAPGSRVQFSWTVQNHVSQSFNQTGDYSFNSGYTSQTNWQNVVLLQGQSVLWGVQP